MEYKNSEINQVSGSEDRIVNTGSKVDLNNLIKRVKE